MRGRGGAIAVLYEPHRKGLLRPSWEREGGLVYSRQHMLEYWACAPLQLRQANQVYRRMRVGAAQRELARDKGARFLPPGYSYANHQTFACRFCDTVLPAGACVWYKGQDHLWWVGRISAYTSTPGQYVVSVCDDPGPVELAGSSARHSKAVGAFCGSWCIQVHQGSFLMRGIVPNADEYRGAELAALPTRNRPRSRYSFFAFVSLVVIGARFVMLSVFLRLCRCVILWAFCLSFHEFPGRLLLSDEPAAKFLYCWAYG